jgi:hypothetical protein
MGSRLILNYHDRQSSRNLLMEMGLWLKKVLIMGASGLVGRAIIEEFKEVYDLYGTYASTQT